MLNPIYLLTCWGIILKGPQSPQRPSPPWPARSTRTRSRTCSQTSLLSRSRNRQTYQVKNKQTISWSLNNPFTRSQSKAGGCWCLGLQSTTEPLVWILTKHSHFHHKSKSYHVSPKITGWRNFQPDIPGGKDSWSWDLHPDQEDKQFKLSDTNSYAIPIHKLLELELQLELHCPRWL